MGRMELRFGDWIPFDAAYLHVPGARRSSMFQPKARELSNACAGVYLIGDHRQGDLNGPASVIYLGVSVGALAPSRFHDRLWKHCCKASGQCGGKFTGLTGEPRDTGRWAAYRRIFKGFDSWYFALAVLDATDDIECTQRLAREAERGVMAEFVGRHGSMPACNSQSLRPSKHLAHVTFPWDGQKSFEA